MKNLVLIKSLQVAGKHFFLYRREYRNKLRCYLIPSDLSNVYNIEHFRISTSLALALL